jgi:hypothetical protein
MYPKYTAWRERALLGSAHCMQAALGGLIGSLYGLLPRISDAVIAKVPTNSMLHAGGTHAAMVGGGGEHGGGGGRVARVAPLSQGDGMTHRRAAAGHPAPHLPPAFGASVRPGTRCRSCIHVQEVPQVRHGGLGDPQAVAVAAAVQGNKRVRGGVSHIQRAFKHLPGGLEEHVCRKREPNRDKQLQQGLTAPSIAPANSGGLHEGTGQRNAWQAPRPAFPPLQAKGEGGGKCSQLQQMPNGPKDGGNGARPTADMQVTPQKATLEERQRQATHKVAEGHKRPTLGGCKQRWSHRRLPHDCPAAESQPNAIAGQANQRMNPGTAHRVARAPPHQGGGS